MKVTEAKLIANLENGKKGGVKTKEGKEKSKMNALKHGILSNTRSEYDEICYLELFKALCEEFEVDTYHQSMLTEELASTYIKLARSAKFQKQKINEALHTNGTGIELISFSTTDEGYESQLGEGTMKSLELISTRYEPQLVNRMIRLINELKKLQKEP